MSYSHLTIVERIKLASEYAVILKDDPAKTPDIIIAELAATFSLSETEAEEAYRLSKKEYAGEYKKAVKLKAWHYIILLLVSLVAGAFYLFLASESGMGFMIVFVILFGLSIIGIIETVGKNIFETLYLKHPFLKKLRKNFLVQLFPLIFLGWGFYGYQLVWSNIISKNDIETRVFKIASPVQYLKSGGKSPQWYYSFYFSGYTKEFRFSKSDFKYASALPDFMNYKVGDTVYAEILKDKKEKLNDKSFFSQQNRIIGFQVEGKSIIHYEKRAALIKKERRKYFNILSIFLAINIIGILWFYKKSRNAEQDEII